MRIKEIAVRAACIVLLFTTASIRGHTVAADEAYTSMTEAAGVLREAMEKRKPSCTIRYRVNENVAIEDIPAVMTDIREGVLLEARKYTGVGNEGEYILYSTRSVEKTVELVNLGEDFYEVELRYKTVYYDNAAKEAAVGRKVKDKLKELKLGGKSDYQKVVAIYNYIVKTVKMDDSPDSSLPECSFSAYGAAIKKKAVCQGFAMLLYRMCNEAGVPCRIVSGNAYSKDGTVHAWNLIRINGKWYQADPSWDSVYVSKKKGIQCFMAGKKFKDHYMDAESAALEPVSDKALDPPKKKSTEKSSVKKKSVKDQSRNEKAEKKKEKRKQKNSLSFAGKHKISFGKKYVRVSKKSGKKKLTLSKKKGDSFRFIKTGKKYYITAGKGKYLSVKGTKIVLSKKKKAVRWSIKESKKKNRYRITTGGKAITIKGKKLVLKKDRDKSKQRFRIQ